jgi:hypothetical protein
VVSAFNGLQGRLATGHRAELSLARDYNYTHAGIIFEMHKIFRSLRATAALPALRMALAPANSSFHPCFAQTFEVASMKPFKGANSLPMLDDQSRH